MSTHFIMINDTNNSDINNNVYTDSDKYRYNIAEAEQCYIVAACIKTKGLPNNCYELRTLRSFRGEYVKNLFDGREIISNYYDIALIIVRKLSRYFIF